MKKTFCVVSLLCLLLFSLHAGETVERSNGHRNLSSKPIDLVFSEAASAPVIDGMADDECWRGVRAVRIPLKGVNGETIFVELKTVTFRGTAYFLLTCANAEEMERDFHWCWDPVRHAYFLSGGETAVVFVFSTESAKFADVWIWRHSRNDPANFADDMWLPDVSDLELTSLRMDAGRPAWFSRYFAEFAGAELPRFYSRTPSGSAGDVKGRSSLRNGVATIELSRKIDTKHGDDVKLSGNCRLRLLFRSGRKSDFEMPLVTPLKKNVDSK